jgi:hypothetical protein
MNFRMKDLLRTLQNRIIEAFVTTFFLWQTNQGIENR